jgi:hypothetical protein
MENKTERGVALMYALLLMFSLVSTISIIPVFSSRGEQKKRYAPDATMFF